MKPGDGVPGQPTDDRWVPRDRFNEVNERAKLADMYERILQPHRERITRDPATGEWRLALDGAAGNGARAPAQYNSILNDEEYASLGTAGFTDEQAGVVDRLLATIGQRLMQQMSQSIDSRGQFQETWDKLLSEFPDLATKDEKTGRLVTNKESELYKLANDTWLNEYHRNGVRTPQSWGDAVLRAWRQLEVKKAEIARREEANKPIEQQNALVGAKASKGQRKGKLTVGEFERLSPEDQEQYLKETSGFTEGGLGG